MNIIASAPLIDFTAPIGTVVDHYTATLSDGQSQNAAVVDGSSSISFSFDVQPGAFTVVTTAFAADGSTIGSPTISDPLVVSLPTTITVKVPGKPVLAQA